MDGIGGGIQAVQQDRTLNVSNHLQHFWGKRVFEIVNVDFRIA
jgi:hypothetical protein